MQAHTSQTNANKAPTDSHEKRSSEQLSVFGGSESASALQLKAAREMADKSPQSNKLAQLKTDIRHTTGSIDLDGKGSNNRMVGKSMYAKLDPKNAVRGSATGINSDWMRWIRGKHPDANVVRGHLLNHDLGGFGIEENLYPISTRANADHSSIVEQNVKGALAKLNEHVDNQNQGYVHYRVNVNEKDSYRAADFDCAWRVEYPARKWASKRKGAVITSNLGIDTGGFGGGPKDNYSPRAWQHGSSKGGREVTSVKRRLNAAVEAGEISFTNKKGRDPFKTVETDQQDSIEWLNDYLDDHGFEKTLEKLNSNYERSKGDQKRAWKRIIGQLKKLV